MIEPRIIIKANNDRTSITIRVTAIDSPDWVDIVSTRIELSRDSSFSNIFYTNSTTHYKVRAYLDDETPNQTIYGRVTLTKEDNTTLVKTFNFITPYPVLGTVKNEENTQYITSMRKMDKNGNLSSRDYSNRATTGTPAHIDIMADETGEMIVGNQWTTPILVQNITQGTAQVEVAQRTQATIAVNTGDIVRVVESSQRYTFTLFQNYQQPLCKGVSAHIVAMPPIEDFLRRNTSSPMDHYFFYYFNNNGTLTSLPEGSFDLRGMPASWNTYGAFQYFNASGALTSLPEGSFDTSNFTKISSDDFMYFNSYGALTSLPEGSFDFDNLTAQCSFEGFNQNGALQSLPEGSFGFSNVASLGYAAFAGFNSRGRIASLPDGSFHFKKNSTAGNSRCFKSFNYSGSLTSFPEHALNFTLVYLNNPIGFDEFNYGGALTSLPEGSFRFDSSVTYINGFQNFNCYGALTSLPEGSFNTDSVTRLGGEAFQNFNCKGALTSLPEDSFNFDNVTTLSGQNALYGFNLGGALRTLPKGSFSFKNLTTANPLSNNGFASYFNSDGGALEYLPVGAFSIDGLPDGFYGFTYFNGYELINTVGKLAKSDTDYNSRFVNTRTDAHTFSYYDASTQTGFDEAVSPRNPTKYFQADAFNVYYSQSQAYTTDLASEYLSGQVVTFTAISTDPDYTITPAIMTEGGVTIPVTDNGDNTFTFTMPQDNIDVTFTLALPPARILLVAEEPGTMLVTNRWTTPIVVKNVTQDAAPVTIAGNSSSSIAVNLDDEISVEEGTAGNTFRNWRTSNYQTGLGLATGVLTRIDSMPEMDRFTANSNGTSVNRYFFADFCAGDSNGKGITALPAGSFDLSGITTPASNFFENFNKKGLLTSLPAGSFDISNIVVNSSHAYFFADFNIDGALTSLPAGSFDTSNMTVAGANFFYSFNMRGALTSLPAGSFDTSSLRTLSGQYVFGYFNGYGALTSLPAGSFDTSSITSANGTMAFASFNSHGELTSLPNGSFDLSGVTYTSGNFFQSFNSDGKLTSLPDGSFDISNIINAGESFFMYFNQGGALTSLPAGSFRFSPSLTTVRGSFFYEFNSYSNGGTGQLTSLPAGSFDTSHITTVGANFFNGFNKRSELTSLPAGSFDTSNITSAGNNFFSEFNSGGKLASLPAGSFDISNITSGGLGGFFSMFNYQGRITSLPAGSFDTSNLTYLGANSFYQFAAETQGKVSSLSLPAGSFRFDNLTTVGNSFCHKFNYKGMLDSLPAGSFNFDSLTTAGTSLFESFNDNGRLTSLPAGSFNTDSLTTVGNNAFRTFNNAGSLTYLPIGSFSTNNLTSVGTSFCYNFNASSGRLTKSTTSHNPNFINASSSNVTAAYYNPSSTATIVPNAPFYYCQSASYNINYATPSGFTTTLPNTGLSGKTVTFSTTASTSGYYSFPTVMTTGGVPVQVVDNSNTSFSFEMPTDDVNVTFALTNIPYGMVYHYGYKDDFVTTWQQTVNYTITDQTKFNNWMTSQGVTSGQQASFWYSSGQWNYYTPGGQSTTTVEWIANMVGMTLTPTGGSFQDGSGIAFTKYRIADKSTIITRQEVTSQADFNKLTVSGGAYMGTRNGQLYALSNGSILNQSITKVTVGRNITSLPNYFLTDCIEMATIDLSLATGLATIGNAVLYDSAKLNCTLSLSNVTTIGSNFLSQASLSSVFGLTPVFNSTITFPKATSIGDSFMASNLAFNKNITFPSTLTSLGGTNGIMTHLRDMTSTVYCNCSAPTASTSPSYSFASTSSSAACYTTGIKFTGTYKSAWATKFPNRTSSPYRKITTV